jgi:hypothetical protein
MVENRYARREVHLMKLPDKFPPGCTFVSNFSGDDFVRFPDGGVFRLNDDGETLDSVPSLPMRGAPSSADVLLNAARVCREFRAGGKVTLGIELALEKSRAANGPEAEK